MAITIHLLLAASTVVLQYITVADGRSTPVAVIDDGFLPGEKFRDLFGGRRPWNYFGKETDPFNRDKRRISTDDGISNIFGKVPLTYDKGFNFFDNWSGGLLRGRSGYDGGVNPTTNGVPRVSNGYGAFGRRPVRKMHKGQNVFFSGIEPPSIFGVGNVEYDKGKYGKPQTHFEDYIKPQTHFEDYIKPPSSLFKTSDFAYDKGVYPFSKRPFLSGPPQFVGNRFRKLPGQPIAKF